MFYNFLKPSQTFEDSLNAGSTSDAWLVAIVTAAIFAVGVFIFSRDIFLAAGGILSLVLQFYILSCVIYVLEFMMKNKRKKLSERSFDDILAAVGKLWMIPLIMGIVLMVIIAVSNNLVALISAIVMAILALLFLYNLYVLLKVTLQAKRVKAIIALIVTLMLHGLITTLILGIIGMLF